MKILLLGMLLTTAISSTGIVNKGIYLGNFDTELKIANTISTEKDANSAIKKMNCEPVEGPGDIVVKDGPDGNYTFGGCFFTKMCSTNNFLIYYDNGVSKSMAHSYAIEYESMQMFYENLGFRPPKYESEYYSSIHKMRVGLLKNLSTFAPAWRTGEGQMIHTGLPETFDNGQKCGIAHEFMHSIQASYNTSMAGWIAEGAADWGMFAYTGEECECGGGAIHGFISNNSFLFDSNNNVKYGASFFFLTMERMYGAESVREFYDNLESIMGTTYTESGCIRALNATLYKYDSDYGELLNKMHIFSVNPQCYFGSYKTVNSWGKKQLNRR